MSHFTTQDGTEIFYKDWGNGQPIVFCHGWPLNSDSFESQMLYLASRGYRCIAHDRRGHGRSSQTWSGNDMDTYADDLARLLETCKVENACLVGFSTGGGEVARYVGRYGTKRVSKAVFVSSVTPLLLKSEQNPAGVPREVFDGMRTSCLTDRSQFYRDFANGPFFGFNRPGARVSQGMVDSFWLQGMMAGHRNAIDCIRAFSETDFTADLRKCDVPCLVIHGDDDQVVPIAASAKAAAKLLKDCKLVVYPGAPHGVCDTQKERLNEDLLGFLKA
ncbi:MAG TPA: alpha/beta hydrolase [Candidatus Polarisedimenticolia bacterium]|nr:alpha/beta hydrolase [Candidatus Polarisedimenticolia bacterium]